MILVDFETWRGAFERDPVGRERLGVRRYRVCRPIDDSKYVLIDLDFDSAAESQTFLTALEQVWSRVELSPGLARGAEPGAAKPRARIVEEVEAQEY